MNEASMVIDLLQRVGLNKYEAEAYAALLQHGPLTGYELGKRSAVPLSRSYEILERLTARGLALVQPGDPPRYAAEAPEQFLGRTRTATAATLDALERALAELEPPALPEGFWVVRGQEPILAQANTYIGQARRTLALSGTLAHSAALEQALAHARERGCRITQPLDEQAGDAATVLLVADEREAMVGSLAPAERAQAVASANPGFIAVLMRCCASSLVFNTLRTSEVGMAVKPAQSLDWLDWEERKQRRLLDVLPGNLVG
jgi:HTH-type transcriptional regulator, sugar sensing transcriptional regulator